MSVDLKLAIIERAEHTKYFALSGTFHTDMMMAGTSPVTVVSIGMFRKRRWHTNDRLCHDEPVTVLEVVGEEGPDPDFRE